MPSDTFNVAGPIESNPAAAWVKVMGTTISSDGNFATGGQHAMYHWNDPAINADKQYSQILIPAEMAAAYANTFSGSVRLQDSVRSGYTAYYYRGAVEYGWAILLRIDNGSMVPLGSGIQTSPPPLSLRLEMQGNQLVLKKKAGSDSDWITIRSATDATYPTGKVGLLSEHPSAGFFLDAWEGGSLGAGVDHSGLLLRGVG